MSRCSLWFLLFSLAYVYGDQDNADSKPPLWNATYTDLLKRDLLSTYDKYARPTQHFNLTKVSLDMTLRHIELDDVNSLMTVNGWIHMVWNDEKLTWNVSEYGGLNVLHVADHEVWQPDLVLYNSAVGNNLDHFGNTQCLVYPNGTVLWVPPAQFSFFCDLDLTKWPFDMQVCNFRIGSWTYSGYQIDLQINESARVTIDIAVSEWSVLNIAKKRNVVQYPCCAEPYVDIEYTVTVKRRSPTYPTLIINPAIAVFILAMCVFWIPPYSAEKFIVTGFTIMVVCILLTYFYQRLPNMGLNPPLIVLFYSNSLVLLCLCMVLSVINYNLYRVRPTEPMPRVISRLLNGILGTVLWLPNQKQNKIQNKTEKGGIVEEMAEKHCEGETNYSEKETSTGHGDWLNLAVAIDRIAFVVYLLLFLWLALRYVF